MKAKVLEGYGFRYTGQTGEVVETDMNDIKLKFSDGRSHWYDKGYVQLIPEYKTIILKDKTYQVLKPITGEEGFKYKTECKEWKDNFDVFIGNYGMFYDASINSLFDEFLARHPKVLPWLIENGFLKEVEKKKEKKKVELEVSWHTVNEYIFPYQFPNIDTTFKWSSLINKQGKLTFEWEE